jgi:hypothetical protein
MFEDRKQQARFCRPGSAAVACEPLDMCFLVSNALFKISRFDHGKTMQA